MKNVKFTFLCFIALLFAINTTAQDAVHGVGGYYAYTAKQMESEGIIAPHSNPAAIPGWGANITNDGEYVKIQMNINNANPIAMPDGTKQFEFRSGFGFREALAGQGIMTLTKDYPVLAVKLGMPKNNETLTNTRNNFFTEYVWYNPITGAKERVPLNGIPGNGKADHVRSIPYLPNQNGADSLIILRRVNTSLTPPVIWDGVQVDDPLASAIYYVDFSTVFAEYDVDAFKMAIYGFSCFASADTLRSTPVMKGDTIIGYNYSEEVKTKDEVPTYYLKWVRTFASQDEVKEFVSYNNGDGNDTRSDNQLLLNTQLYHAKEFAKTYKFADESALTPFAEAVAAAEIVYQSTPPNDDKESAEYKAWDQTVADAITALTQAQKSFLEVIALELNDYYNTLKTADESYGITLGAETTIGSLTGRPLTVGASNAASGFIFNELGIVNGQRAYKLITAEGTVVVADDKSLMLVPSALATATNTASFIFSNRADNEYPNFDMKVGSNFYYVGEDNTLKYVEELPDADALEELFSYLFVVTEGIYDNSANESATNPGLLFAGWEFDQSSKTIDNERLTLPEDERTRFDGWGMQRWRMYTKYTWEEKDGNSCIALRIAPVYYAWNDVPQATPIVTSYPQGAALTREHGIYSTDEQRDPDGGVRDSTYIIYTNTYTKRYFAIKWGATSADVTFDNLTLFMPGTSGTVVLNTSNMEGRKGDVHYWDMLKLGIPYGDRGFCAQFLAFTGIPSADDVVYVDWMRTYVNMEDIPEEKFSFTGNSIENENADNSQVKIYSPAANTIEISNESAENAIATVYSVNGSVIAQKNFSSSATISVNQAGLYIVTVRTDNHVHVGKLIVK